jgi:hypothetical protein
MDVTPFVQVGEFTISPNYVHCPAFRLTTEPPNGVSFIYFWTSRWQIKINGGNSYFCEDISFGFLQWYASKQLFHICVCFSFYTLSLFSADLASAHMRVIRSRSQKARSGNTSHHSQLASHVGISASSLCTSSHFSRELLKTPYKLCFRHGIPAKKKIATFPSQGFIR